MFVCVVDTNDGATMEHYGSKKRCILPVDYDETTASAINASHPFQEGENDDDNVEIVGIGVLRQIPVPMVLLSVQQEEEEADGDSSHSQGEMNASDHGDDSNNAFDVSFDTLSDNEDDVEIVESLSVLQKIPLPLMIGDVKVEIQDSPDEILMIFEEGNFPISLFTIKPDPDVLRETDDVLVQSTDEENVLLTNDASVDAHEAEIDVPFSGELVYKNIDIQRAGKTIKGRSYELSGQKHFLPENMVSALSSKRRSNKTFLTILLVHFVRGTAGSLEAETLNKSCYQLIRHLYGVSLSKWCTEEESELSFNYLLPQALAEAKKIQPKIRK